MARKYLSKIRKEQNLNYKTDTFNRTRRMNEKKCPVCGIKLNSDDTFCYKCRRCFNSHLN